MRTDKNRFTGFLQPPGMAEVRSTKPSVNEASFTGQTQEQFFRFNLRLFVCIGG
jgi:hypothetical protein